MWQINLKISCWSSCSYYNFPYRWQIKYNGIIRKIFVDSAVLLSLLQRQEVQNSSMPWMFQLKVSLRIILRLLRALSKPGGLLVSAMSEIHSCEAPFPWSLCTGQLCFCRSTAVDTGSIKAKNNGVSWTEAEEWAPSLEFLPCQLGSRNKWETERAKTSTDNGTVGEKQSWLTELQ